MDSTPTLVPTKLLSMETEYERKSFGWWQARLANMRAADLHNFFCASFEQQEKWCAEIAFLSAVVDRFALLAAFSQELTDENRARCISESQCIADMIRKVYRDEPQRVARFEDAFSHANDLYKLFGFGTAAFEIGVRETPEANPIEPTLVLSKCEAAEIQIKASVRCYEIQDWLSSVTLAGAAECCLPKVEEKHLFAIAKDVGKRRGIESNELIKLLNEKRDWAKHNGEDHKKFTEYCKTDAAIMIVRAITKYFAVFGQQTEVMNEFEERFRREFPEIVGG